MLTGTLGEPGAALRVLCIGAHADDIEIGCGGTILQLLDGERSVEVHWIVLSGDRVRAEEARSSARSFLTGADGSAIAVKEFRDGHFPFVGEGLKEYFEELKEAEPDVIFTHTLADRHQDHRTVAELTWNTFRGHLILEYEVPKYDGDLGRPNVFFPLGAETSARKVDLIWEGFPSQRDRHWFTRDTFAGLMRLRGMESGGVESHAEGFFCRKLVLGW